MATVGSVGLVRQIAIEVSMELSQNVTLPIEQLNIDNALMLGAKMDRWKLPVRLLP